VTASCIYEGTIRHRRHEPVRHELRHPIALLFVDLGELPVVLDRHPLWSARRRAFGRLRRADHLGDPSQPLDAAVRDVVEAASGARPAGPVRLLTQPRTFGHGFTPVSFYYCYEPGGERVRAVVAEVTNTPWGERHAYVLAGDRDGRALQGGLQKAFHVSPFMGMDHRYRWRVVEPGRELLVHIEAERAGRRAFDATLTLRRRELDAHALNRLLWRYPAAPLVGQARIYAHALRLALKGAPYFPHPGRA
jgi:DUF1365 family protein